MVTSSTFAPRSAPAAIGAGGAGGRPRISATPIARTTTGPATTSSSNDFFIGSPS